MNTVIDLWIAAPLLGTAVILQWTALRTKYRNELTKQRARHEQHQQTASRDIEQAKRQIGQLQHDLAAARLQLKRLSMSGAAPTQSDPHMKEALNRMLDDASASRRHLPTNGFADTQPSLHSQHDVGLLFR
jgi:chromosome segregation ATPase